MEALKGCGRDRTKIQTVLDCAFLDIKDVKKYLHFDKTFYTRNLVLRTEDFEAILLCWEVGQITPIHDHSGSEGWMYGLQGTVVEVQYHADRTDPKKASVTKGKVTTIPIGAAGHINDSIAMHSVENTGAGQGVTLHVYSPPIDVCDYFDTETQTFKERKLSYHTIDGVKQ